MPEDPIIAVFVNKLQDHRNRIIRKKEMGGKVMGKWRFHLRTWAMGTPLKPHNTCTVHAVEGSKLPVFDTSTVNRHDLARCGRTGDHRSWLPLLADHEPGELLFKQRGKELLIAAGSLLVTINFSLEACLAQCSSEEFARLTETCVSGGAKEKKKAMVMRSFLAPRDLVVPGSRAYRSKEVRRLNILLSVESAGTVFFVVDHNRLAQFRALYRERHWTPEDIQNSGSDLWPPNLGPDWVTEVNAAFEQADIWRNKVLGSGNAAPIAGVLTSDRTTFNGFGRHTSNNVCHRLQLHPATPVYEVCNDGRNWLDFKRSLHEYLVSLRTPAVLKNAGGTINSLYPFQFHATGSRYFINNCITVFRKGAVRMPIDHYLAMYKKGLFDPDHVIGEPYAGNSPRSSRYGSLEQPVFKYIIGNKEFFTAIQARLPDHWPSGTMHAEHDGWRDLQHEGDTPTIGPQQFHIYTINRIHVCDWEAYADSLKDAARSSGMDSDEIESLPLLDDEGIPMGEEVSSTEIIRPRGRPRLMSGSSGKGGRRRAFKVNRELQQCAVPLSDEGCGIAPIATRTRAQKSQDENTELEGSNSKRRRLS